MATSELDAADSGGPELSGLAAAQGRRRSRFSIFSVASKSGAPKADSWFGSRGTSRRTESRLTESRHEAISVYDPEAKPKHSALRVGSRLRQSFIRPRVTSEVSMASRETSQLPIRKTHFSDMDDCLELSFREQLVEWDGDGGGGNVNAHGSDDDDDDADSDSSDTSMASFSFKARPKDGEPVTWGSAVTSCLTQCLPNNPREPPQP